MSKHDEITERSELKKLVGLLSKDALVDFVEDHGEEYSSLTEKGDKHLYKKAT
eukprot:TRINITY_DN2014_c0_g1_i1.p2 TRINITY_DN2014_c0_g1~~TRINITY_DN2014_c0_g1_i1.p2  ORF type:complete len:53 (-),score=7.80 TRINITY_DN2014_c0_g1_i1:211-369(-)